MAELKTRVLVVDDDMRLRELLVRYLGEQGLEVRAVPDAAGMDRQLARERYDLIVLDLMLPGEDGLAICRRLRQSNAAPAILMLTAKGDDVDRIVGLEIGADDYLAKPFSFSELFARLRALVRRGPAERPPILQVGDLRLDPASRRVTRGKHEVALTAKEFALLEYFMRRAGEVLSRTRLIEHVWDFGFEADSNIVDVYVRYLREKIDRPYGRDTIETVRGSGYRLRTERR